MANIQHRDIPDIQLHEPKGASTSTTGQILTSTGGASTWAAPDFTGLVQQGVYDYNDLATATTQIPLTVASTQYEMTNDGAGAFTNLNYTLPGLDNIWNTTTNRFGFNGGAGLKLGDTVDIRFDFEVTTTAANTAIEFDLELGVGGSPYQLVINPLTNFKAAGTYKVIRWLGVYMGDSNTLDNPARVLAQADSTGSTVKVNGWYARALSTV
jgi:hypothetical protein